MHRFAVRGLAVLLLAIVPATDGSAQNLLANPDFDNDISGWSGLGSWDPLDAFGLPSSGSGTWVNTFTSGGASYLTQCVETPVFIEGYGVSAMAYIPSGQTSQGHAQAGVAFYSSPGCTDFISNHMAPEVTAFDSWQMSEASGWTPRGTVSVKVVLNSHKTDPDDFQVFHDAVSFGPNPTMIFGDGFESVDLSQWSASVGYRWVGAYDDCSVEPCESGFPCVAIAGIDHGPTCLPYCAGPGECPGREGIPGDCALSPGARSLLHCALLCDPGTPVCPTGMDCFDLGGGGACLWPEP